MLNCPERHWKNFTRKKAFSFSPSISLLKCIEKCLRLRKILANWYGKFSQNLLWHSSTLFCALDTFHVYFCMCACCSQVIYMLRILIDVSLIYTVRQTFHVEFVLLFAFSVCMNTKWANLPARKIYRTWYSAWHYWCIQLRAYDNSNHLIHAQNYLQFYVFTCNARTVKIVPFHLCRAKLYYYTILHIVTRQKTYAFHKLLSHCKKN